jgi:hypothetical protein
MVSIEFGATTDAADPRPPGSNLTATVYQVAGMADDYRHIDRKRPKSLYKQNFMEHKSSSAIPPARYPVKVCKLLLRGLAAAIRVGAGRVPKRPFSIGYHEFL